MEANNIIIGTGMIDFLNFLFLFENFEAKGLAIVINS